MHSAKQILLILDQCASVSAFPMLDNGYVYPAATRLGAFRSEDDWALVIEVFGFNPRAGWPDTCVYTCASTLGARTWSACYNREQLRSLQHTFPNSEMYFVYPVGGTDWQDPDDFEHVAIGAERVLVRDRAVRICSASDLPHYGIECSELPRVCVFELCRFLAETERDDVLATTEERRIGVLPGMKQVLQLEEWRHPDLCEGERPSQVETFRQIAEILAGERAENFEPAEAPNSHWRNWPSGGTL